MVKNIILGIVSMLLYTNNQQDFVISTKGYYFATYSLNLGENDFFEETAIILLKFDNDGYCNVFDIPIAKGNTVEDEIIDIKKRVYTNNPTNSGLYTINKDKIMIKYSIFNNPKHLLGKYINIYYEGITINDNKIKLKINKGYELEFKYVKDESIGFRNYFRENKNRF